MNMASSSPSDLLRATRATRKLVTSGIRGHSRDSSKRYFHSGPNHFADMDRVLDSRPGSKVLLLGNEAIARAALEAGVAVATTYPGTPASEIGDALARVAKEAGIYFE